MELERRKFCKHYKRKIDQHGKRTKWHIWKEEYMYQTTRTSKRKF